ncbi:MAG: PDZ domain-containing protein, partial [Thermodesulfobacteriota bacterium]
QEITPEIAQQLRLNELMGVVVSQLEPGGAADEAGIQRGDVIREVNGYFIRNHSDYRAALAKLKKGEIIRLLVRRGERNLYLTIRNSKGE